MGVEKWEKLFKNRHARVGGLGQRGGCSMQFLLTYCVEGIKYKRGYLIIAYYTCILLAIEPITKHMHALTFLSNSKEQQHEVERPRPNMATPNLQQSPHSIICLSVPKKCILKITSLLMLCP